MQKEVKQHHENFIKGIRLLQGEKNLKTLQDVSDFLKIKYPALYKIMDGTNRPTIEMTVLLCKKGGFSADWMVLNLGDVYLKQQATLNQILGLLEKKR